MAEFLLVSMNSPGLFPVKSTLVLSVTHSSRQALTHTLCQELCGLTSHAHAGGYCGITHDDRTALGIVQLTQTHTLTPKYKHMRTHQNLHINTHTINRGMQINILGNPRSTDKRQNGWQKLKVFEKHFVKNRNRAHQSQKTERGRTIIALLCSGGFVGNISIQECRSEWTV